MAVLRETRPLATTQVSPAVREHEHPEPSRHNVHSATPCRA
jgi:hypothetical protein